MDEKMYNYILEQHSKNSDRAVALVKAEARRILREDLNLDEFVMAMGRCFFTIKEGGKYDTLQMTDDEFYDWQDSDDYVYSYNGIVDDDMNPNFHPEFWSMVDELNTIYSVCGYPVRFKANTNEVHHWGDTQKNPVKYEERC